MRPDGRRGRRLARPMRRIAAAALLAAITGAVKTPTPAGTAQLTEHGAILSGDLARPVFNQCSRLSPRSAVSDWTPSPDDVARLEERLPAFIAALGAAGPRLPLSEYRRQYVGFTGAGRRYIYVNCFPRNISDDDPRPAYRNYWQHAPVIVCDGGDAFFGVEYDVERGTFQHYAANGAV